MIRYSPIVTYLAVCQLVVYQYSAAAAQPPIVTPQPRIQSRQSPVTQVRIPDSTPEPDSPVNPEDAWFLIQYDDATIGYETLTTTAADAWSRKAGELESSDQLPLIRRSRETRLKLKRFGNDLSVSAHLETIESIDGLLYSWSLRRTAADGSVVMRSATWRPDRNAFELTGDTNKSQSPGLLPSLVQPRSPIFPVWLWNEKLERPQQWASAVLFPESSAVVDVEIRQQQPQSLRLQNGKTIGVTRFDYWPTNQPELRSSVYYDQKSEVVLIEQPLLGRTLRFYRTDAASALGEENLKSLDLQFLTALPLRRPLLNADKSNEVRMMISVGLAEQISLPSGDLQVVEQTVPNSLTLTLSRPPENTDSAVFTRPSQSKHRVDPRFTESTRWINSADDSVRRMAVFGGGAVADPREKCRRLSSYIHSHLQVTAFSTSMLPASDVAKSKQGDCTEYSILLAALMRSEGIPSRVAVGFVYVANPASFAPHMWTEAWIDGQWIPFDATLGGEANPMTRFKVTDSSMPDGLTNGTVLFVPLLNFLGRATVEILPEKQQ